jgi:hypothetical protein
MTEGNSVLNETYAGTEAMTEREWYEVFRDARRRTTLEVIRTESKTFSLDSLAESVATREDEVAANDETRKRVATSLHHVHLPKMAAVGLVSYNMDEQRITLTDSACVT